ncbi:MAG: hydantoinase B/oxoprolinase family protein, partial [Nitrospira sp.]|nr:hydantoinase B/oxoprolinase family protein [Nitrospira sp.]
GRRQGGEGVVRTYHFLQSADITVLSDRRVTRPYGLEGGQSGQSGRNGLMHKGMEKELPGKCSMAV